MELKYKNMNFIVGQLYGMDFENCYHDMVIVYKDNGVEEQYEHVGYFWGSNIDEETTKIYAIETIEKWLEEKNNYEKTLYDLFVEQESFILEIEIDKEHRLFIENLDQFGGCKAYYEEFNKQLLTNEILVEVTEYVEEYGGYELLFNVVDNNYGVDLSTKVNDLVEIAKNLIKGVNKYGK